MWQLMGITIILVTTKSLNIECTITKNIPTIQNDINKKLTNKNDYYLPKQLKKRSIVKLDFHDGTNYEVQKLSSPPEGINSESSYWPEIQIDKESKNQLFTSWGGKRDSNSYKTDPKIRRPARVPFNSWGGKRDSEKIYHHHDDDDDDNDENNDYTMIFKKPFNKWNNKHSTNFIIKDLLRQQTTNDDIFDKNWQYQLSNNDNNLMDKRNLPNKLSLNNNNNLPRIPFEPWGGRKRRDINYEKIYDVTIKSINN